MSRIGETASNRTQADVFQGQVDATRAHQEVLRGLDGKQACPFCGSVSERSASPCPRCGMDNTPEARKATKSRIGPWYVLQARNPAAPGMRFETLLSFVRKGRVRARSVVRGPTTHQLWRFAAHVKGLSREFGMCFSCGSAIETAASICPQCNRLQEPPINPDVLLENDADEASARAPIFRELPTPQGTTVAPQVEQPAPDPEPEDIDIVVPALGGFEPDALEPKFSDDPVVAPPQEMATESFGQPARNPAPRRPAASVPPRPSLDDNAFAIGGRRKNAGGNDPSFLSAKELAAAFKLSFDPSANLDNVEIPDQMPSSVMPDGMGAGSFSSRKSTMSSPDNFSTAVRPKRRSGFKKFVLFVLILAATGFTVLMWVDPAFRQRTVEWTTTQFNRAYNYASSPSVEPTTTAPADSFEVPDPPAVVPDPPAANIETVPAQPAPAVPEPAITLPAEEPIVQSPQAPAVEEAPAPVRRTAPTETPAPASADTARDFDADLAAMRKLYAEGVQAQGALDPDYEAAVRAYEQIKTLPRSVWPSDLERRLAQSKAALAK